MGDLQDEIRTLLGELERKDEKSSEAVEFGPSGEQDSEEGVVEETTETDGEEVSAQEDSQKSDESEEEVTTRSQEEGSELERLRAEVERLAAQVKQEPEGSPSKEEADSQKEFDPLGEHDFDTILESKEAFAKWASDFYQKARQQARDDILNELPQTVSSQVEQQVMIREQVRDFYAENPDLENVKNYVVHAANQVASENPEMTFDKILNEAAKRTRETLGIKGQTQDQPKEKPAKSEFAKTSKGGTHRGKKAEPQRTETEKQIDELLEAR